MVLLPEPEGPTIAVVCPALIAKLAPSRTFLTFSGARGYLNVTLSNLIALSRVKLETHPSWSLIAGFLSITSKMLLPTTLAFIIAYMFGFNPKSNETPDIRATKIFNSSPVV